MAVPTAIGGRVDLGSVTSQVELGNGSVEVVIDDSICVRMSASEPAAVAALIRYLQDAPRRVDPSATTSRFQRIELTHRAAAQQ